MSDTTHYTQGQRLLRQGRYVEAAEELGAVAQAPGLMGQLARYYQGQALREAGLAEARQGRLDHAQAHLRQAIDLLGGDASLAAYLARLYARMGLPQRAEAQLEAACAHQPDHVAHAAALAAVQDRNGGRERAMLTLHDALRRHPDDVGLHMQLALVHARDEQYADARSHLQRAIECDCLNAQAHYHLGLIAAAEGDFLQAARSLERACGLDPHNLLLTYQLAGIARVAAGQGHAVHMRLGSVQFAPSTHTPDQAATSHLHHLANLVCREHDFVPAFLALPAGGHDAELFGLLGTVLDTALAGHPDYADLHLQRAQVAQRLSQQERALAHARRAVAIHPDYVAGRVLLGRLLSASNPAEALEHLERAVRIGGDFADVHTAIAGVLERLGRLGEARRALERALRINGNYRQAGEALRRLAA